ncbi:MAG TPA: ABC transporter ATP-binding protein [Herpetosiphonaceae bacterium]
MTSLGIASQPAIAIELRGVTKRYGQHLAVQDLNLTAARGEVLGFLGPNGAGKTTTIRLLTGFLRPSAGTIRLAGCDMARPDEALHARAELGFVPDVAGLDPATTGARLLDELARLQRRPAIDREPVREALDLATEDLHRPIGALSRGTRQKINLVQGLQHRPGVLILDEPTEGLDPLGKRALFMLLQAARRRGATIFFSSHVLSEVEELCDRVALIRGGRLIAVDHIAGLLRHTRRQITLHVEDQPIERLLAALPTVADLRYAEERWRFSVAELQPLLRLLATLPVRDVTIEPPSLADVFLQHYRPAEADDA